MYEEIIRFENLFWAYRQARLQKRDLDIQQKYEFTLETNLSRLRRKLTNPKYYKVRPYREFTVCEPKRRQISAPHFEDRIIHQAIVRVIGPIIVKEFIPQTYACIKNRGTHKAVFDIKKTLTQMSLSFGGQDLFYFKSDISQYFASIDHKILKELLRKHIFSPETLCLLDKIIDSYQNNPGKGIPIGNLTSQLFANLYLNELDQFVNSKNDFQNRYFRYMDDFVIISGDKDKLKRLKSEIAVFLENGLKLTLHPRKRLIQRASFGIDFCGYNIFTDKILLRKKTIRRFVRKYKRASLKIDDLEKELGSYLFSEMEVQIKQKIDHLQTKLEHAVVSHRGFLKYSQINKDRGEYAYANNIRLPFLRNDNRA